VRDVSGGKVADREFGCSRVEEQLVLGEFDVFLGGVDDALGAALERRFKLRWSTGAYMTGATSILGV
jgi:hypothetical protein